MKTLTISATLALLTTFVHAVPINSARQFQLVVVIDQGAPTKPAPLADNKITFFGGAPGQSFDQTIPSTDSQDDTGALPLRTQAFPTSPPIAAEGSYTPYFSNRLKKLIVI